jgi:hypothetical protein
METVNIHEAKPHLSRLVEQAAKGNPFIILKWQAKYMTSRGETDRVRILGPVL